MLGFEQLHTMVDSRSAVGKKAEYLLMTDSRLRKLQFVLMAQRKKEKKLNGGGSER